MTKELFSMRIDDVSSFARTLGQALHERHANRPAPPGQVELLNLIARARGERNWQALRRSIGNASSAAPSEPLAARRAPGRRPVAEALPLSVNARKALAHFDDEARLSRWPVKFSIQKLVMWVLWTRFDAKRAYTESEVNAVLKAANAFADHVTLRRELINHRLMGTQKRLQRVHEAAGSPRRRGAGPARRLARALPRKHCHLSAARPAAAAAAAGYSNICAAASFGRPQLVG